MNFKEELQKLIKLHKILKKEDDCCYVSDIKNHIEDLARKLKKANNAAS